MSDNFMLSESGIGHMAGRLAMLADKPGQRSAMKALADVWSIGDWRGYWEKVVVIYREAPQQ